MVMIAIFQHYVTTKLLLSAFDTANLWGAATLPGVVDTLRIPQTKDKPEDDSLDLFGIFDGSSLPLHSSVS